MSIRIRGPVLLVIPLALVLFLVGLVFINTSGENEYLLESKRFQRPSRSIPKNINMDFATIDFSTPSVPQEIQDKVSFVTTRNEKVTVASGLQVHTVRAIPANPVSGINVLLLHGAAFSSATWQELGTINMLASMGHTVAAVDLPGYGKTSALTGANPDKALFLEELMSSLSFPAQDTVVISPSMSGGFSLPYLKKNPALLRGFIPVAPVGTETLKPPSTKGCGEPTNKSAIRHPALLNHIPSTLPDLSCFTTRTMVVFGERDSASFLRGCALLSAMPRANAQMIPKAGHPAYRDDPVLWHTLLYNFLTLLKN